jgi:hypothetical protein
MAIASNHRCRDTLSPSEHRPVKIHISTRGPRSTPWGQGPGRVVWKSAIRTIYRIEARGGFTVGVPGGVPGVIPGLAPGPSPPELLKRLF